MHRSKALRASGALICAIAATTLLYGCSTPQGASTNEPASGPLGTMAQPGAAIQGAKTNVGNAVDKVNQQTQQTLDQQQQTTGEAPSP
jgi:hypothetical protein